MISHPGGICYSSWNRLGRGLCPLICYSRGSQYGGRRAAASQRPPCRHAALRPRVPPRVPLQLAPASPCTQASSFWEGCCLCATRPQPCSSQLRHRLPGRPSLRPSSQLPAHHRGSAPGPRPTGHRAQNCVIPPSTPGPTRQQGVATEDGLACVPPAPGAPSPVGGLRSVNVARAQVRGSCQVCAHTGVCTIHKSQRNQVDPRGGDAA